MYLTGKTIFPVEYIHYASTTTVKLPLKLYLHSYHLNDQKTEQKSFDSRHDFPDFIRLFAFELSKKHLPVLDFYSGIKSHHDALSLFAY